MKTVEDEPSPSPSPEASVHAPIQITPMGPPAAPTNPNPPISDGHLIVPDSGIQSTEEAPNNNSTAQPADVNCNDKQEQSPHVAAPYKIPPWSEAPCHQYSFEVLKDGAIVDQFDV